MAEDVSIIPPGRWGLSRPLQVGGGWTTHAMAQQLAPRVSNYFPPFTDGAPATDAAMVRLVGTVTPPSDDMTRLFPADIVDRLNVTLGSLTANQRQAIRNTLTEWLTGYTYTDRDGNQQTVISFQERAEAYTGEHTLRTVLRDIFRYFSHSVRR